SELTSIVTLKRPAERIDTLEELEDGLDGGGMAPCVYENEAAHEQLMTTESDARGAWIADAKASICVQDFQFRGTKHGQLH
ncbi:hypothetical protein MTO96_030723, partial [Rhipicephalus appendiculatus]